MFSPFKNVLRFNTMLLMISCTMIAIESTPIQTNVSLSHAHLRFVALGDWGSDHSSQRDDAEAIGEFCDHINRCDFILSTGDNFYSTGVTSADSERFQSTWSDVYTHPALESLTWYMTAGNHDHGNGADDGREWFQVEHSKLDPKWYFPDLVYSFKMQAGNSVVKFVSFDTESIRHGTNNPDDMLNALDKELKDPDADWKVVFGHHPCYSAGNYAGSGTMRDRVLPIMKSNNVDIYLTGHEHNLEHWQAKDTLDIDHVTVGAGGQSLHGYSESHNQQMEELGMELQTFQEEYGFAYVFIDENSISWQFVSSDLEVLYEHSREK